MKVYFAGSIMGGTEKQEDYFKLIDFIKKHATVLTEHIFNEKEITDQVRYSDREDEHIFIRDTKWIDQSDMIIAEVSVPSLGVGYEIGYGESIGKKIICLYQNNSDKTLSYMLSGNKNLTIIKYDHLEELEEKLLSFLEVFNENKN